MRIGILSQWYDPEPGPASTTGVMARELLSLGHEVTVLTGFPNYPGGKIAAGYRQSALFREAVDGVNVLRVPLYPSHDSSGARRLANYSSFAMTASILGVPRLPKLDVLWVNYSPITVALPMWLAHYARGVPLICEVADLWPDTLTVAGLTSSRKTSGTAWKILDAWCNAMYASSQAVVHISPSAGTTLRERGVPADALNYIPKAANEVIYNTTGTSLRSALGIASDANVLLYAGAIGAAQDVGSLLRACAQIKPEDRPVVLMAGSGTQESHIRTMASELNLRHVHFLGRLPEEAMTNLMATADMAYVSLTQHATSGATMPSKTQAILASGKGIIAAADGDVADLVRDRAVGFTATPGNVDSIESALRAWLSLGARGTTALGLRAREVYESEFSARRLGEQVDALVRKVAHESRSRLRSSTRGREGTE